MASFDDLYPTTNQQKDDSADYSKIGTMHSMLAGVGSGIIQIPKGLFSLGATLMDLGAGTNKAAEVEKYFDDLTDWDEKAEATTAGKITETLVNLGIPGGVAFTKGAGLASKALRSKKAGSYFTLTDDGLKKAGKKALELNAKGKTARFIAGATAGGVAEGVFVGDVEQIGTFGDLLGGPTQLERDEEYDPTRELINRVKFGTEGALFTGVLGGTGATIKKLATRGDKLRFSNNKIDRLLDTMASKFRSRSGKTKEFFNIERKQIGVRSSDLNLAQETSREMDKSIDAIFPAWKTVAQKMVGKQRNQSLESLHDVLLSGKTEVNEAGRVIFGDMDQGLMDAARKSLKGFNGKTKDINNIFNNMTKIRKGWGDMFSTIGKKMEGSELKEFQKEFGNKFKDWLGGTYDVFQNKSLVPFFGYRPAEEAIKKSMKMMKEVARQNGKKITDEQAKYYVNRIVKTARLPKGFRMDRPSDPLFHLPNFFVGKSMLDDAINKPGFTRLGALPTEHQKIITELLGKRRNPMQTILGGTARLSLIARRNQFFQDLMAESDRLGELKTGRKMFYNADDYDEAVRVLGDDIKQIQIDPAKSLDAAITNPLDKKWAITEVAEALEETSKTLMDPNKIGGKIYEGLVLYPKAVSQMAKTVLSPITHVRNFVSAGAFATANGIIPTPSAMKTAYQALQAPIYGARKQNDLYRELLELGVVNTNVRLGDLTKLLEDVNFGSTMTSDKGMRMLLKVGSKTKRFAQDLYTAEDDFWKIASWAVERDRIGKAFVRSGVKKGDEILDFAGNQVKYGDDFLKNEAAHIVRNNIPNYDYVSDFVKGLRRWPIGNFVSFPAEIMRTSANIARRALRDINYKLPNGAKPLRRLGYQRLAGMGLTTAAVPIGTVKAAQMIYDVTDDEIEAMRRYVADWSKNSTLIPLRDEETGDLKYIDFSHANAYDTIARPFQTILNQVASGREDEDGMMDDFMKGLFEATKELGSPFISESIWTEAAADLIIRTGKTREGSEVWNEKDSDGDKVTKMVKHLVKAAAPFSYEQMKRLKMSVNEDFDKYGQSYELGDELMGFLGMRRVELNPERGLDFKIAGYQDGVRKSRSLFTRTTRLGAGPIEPKEIVDAYINANRALFDTRREMMKDFDAAQLLGLSEDKISRVSERLSKRDVGTLREGVFRPLPLSRDVINAFEENSRKMGVANPLERALPVIERIQEILSLAPLSLEFFPELFNPFGAPESEPEAKVPSNINLNTPMVNPNLITPQLNTAAGGGGGGGTGNQQANMVQTGSVMQNGLTQTEMALLSDEEKAMRLRQRGIA